MEYKKLIDLVSALLIAIDKGLIELDEAKIIFKNSINSYFNK